VIKLKKTRQKAAKSFSEAKNAMIFGLKYSLNDDESEDF